MPTPVKDYATENERLFSVVVAAWHREKARTRVGHNIKGQFTSSFDYPRYSLGSIGYLMFGLSPARVHAVNQKVLAEMERNRRRSDLIAA